MQILSMESLHRDVREGIGFARVVNRDDAGVAHAAGRLGLTQEVGLDLRAELRFARQRNHFDRDFARQDGILRGPHDAVGTPPDFVQDREAPDRLRHRHGHIARGELGLGGGHRLRHRVGIIAPTQPPDRPK